MTDTLTINSEIALAQAQRELAEQWRKNKYLEVTISRKAKQRTLTQNKAMHLFFGWLAETLNDAGLDMKKVLREDIDIPWTRESVKEHLWRPIQKAMTDKQSTTEITTVEPTDGATTPQVLLQMLVFLVFVVARSAHAAS